MHASDLFCLLFAVLRTFWIPWLSGLVLALIFRFWWRGDYPMPPPYPSYVVLSDAERKRDVQRFTRLLAHYRIIAVPWLLIGLGTPLFLSTLRIRSGIRWCKAWIAWYRQEPEASDPTRGTIWDAFDTYRTQHATRVFPRCDASDALMPPSEGPSC